MTCEQTLAQLDDYVDGSLSEPEFQEVELHLFACAECREEERLFRSLLAQAAALPRELSPDHDLWEGISRRLQERPSGAARFRGFFLNPVALAAAAVLLAIFSTLRFPSSRTSTSLKGEARFASLVEPSFAKAEGDYVRASAALKVALDAQRGSLSPKTLKTVDDDLRVIDAALESLRDAVAKDPANGELKGLLIATHQQELDVLRKVTRLSNAL
jgi:anti-sigma factor RsiW